MKIQTTPVTTNEGKNPRKIIPRLSTADIAIDTKLIRQDPSKNIPRQSTADIAIDKNLHRQSTDDIAINITESESNVTQSESVMAMNKYIKESIISENIENFNAPKSQFNFDFIEKKNEQSIDIHNSEEEWKTVGRRTGGM